jgi:O-antigen biosynthesis protein WbqP
VIRVFDFVFSLFGLVLGFPVFLLLFVVGYFDTGAPLFKQERVGRYQKPFTLVKFRTMKLNTVSVATHLADASAITKFGHFLRKTKLDELPQLWNVLNVRPGITGLAQVNEIDMSTPDLLAETDQAMIVSLSLSDYFGYIVKTVLGKGGGDRIKK